MQEIESYTKKVEVLKEKVKDMLMSSKKDLIKNIEFINLLCRLGISYHFENEIEEQLNHIFNVVHDDINDDYDLYNVALLFRVLRQHGYKISCSKWLLMIKIYCILYVLYYILQLRSI